MRSHYARSQFLKNKQRSARRELYTLKPSEAFTPLDFVNAIRERQEYLALRGFFSDSRNPSAEGGLHLSLREHVDGAIEAKNKGIFYDAMAYHVRLKGGALKAQVKGHDLGVVSEEKKKGALLATQRNDRLNKGGAPPARPLPVPPGPGGGKKKQWIASEETQELFREILRTSVISDTDSIFQETKNGGTAPVLCALDGKAPLGQLWKKDRELIKCIKDREPGGPYAVYLFIGVQEGGTQRRNIENSAIVLRGRGGEFRFYSWGKRGEHPWSSSARGGQL